MQQMGRMPSQQINQVTTFVPGLPPQSQNVYTVGQPPFQNHSSSPPHPYQLQYYGPLPPTTPTNTSTESGASPPLNPTFGPSFTYNHHYPPHGYPIQSHHQSPQYYQQYYHPPPVQSRSSRDQYGHLPTDSSVKNELNKIDGRISASADQVDDSEIPVKQLAV